jgi:alcohol dehydrogenase (cytochrome c)
LGHDRSASSVRTLSGRLLAAAAGKAGLLYGIDRSSVATGKTAGPPLNIVYATPDTTRTNVKVPLNTAIETRFCPGTQGGTEWNGPGFSPPLNLLFVNAIDWCASVKVAVASSATGKPGAALVRFRDPEHPFGRIDRKEMWGGWLTAVEATAGVRVGNTRRLSPWWLAPHPPRAAWFLSATERRCAGVGCW